MDQGDLLPEKYPGRGGLSEQKERNDGVKKLADGEQDLSSPLFVSPLGPSENILRAPMDVPKSR